MEDKKLIAYRLKSLREEHNLTMDELAEKLDLKSKSTISKWETEKSENLPRGRELVKLRQLYDTSIDYMLGLSDQREWNKK